MIFSSISIPHLFLLFHRSVRINFQYAIDILCGSLNRACDVKKLFQYIGLKNTQSPIKIEFVFINDTYHDRGLQRTFRPSQATMFACDQAVILPHVSRQKCTCMVCKCFCKWLNASIVWSTTDVAGKLIRTNIVKGFCLLSQKLILMYCCYLKRIFRTDILLFDFAKQM